MAAGGVRDQLGGGFHRYSVDESWSIPHFETMLTDNAQLLGLYARAADLLQVPFYARIAEGAADTIQHALSSPDAGFFTSRASQIDGVEGAPYLWSRPEIAAVLGSDETARFLAVYAIASDSPAADGMERGVLRLRMPLAQTAQNTGFADPAAMLDALASDRGKLASARATAPQPAADDKIVASANGLAIAALAQAGPALRHPEYVASARRAAERVWRACWNAGQALLYHAASGGPPEPGYLDDYAL
ncbi:MAG: thioredoxin domain-containing protein, partial [Geminicoccaceae bacterium]